MKKETLEIDKLKELFDSLEPINKPNVVTIHVTTHNHLKHQFGDTFQYATTMDYWTQGLLGYIGDCRVLAGLAPRRKAILVWD